MTGRGGRELAVNNGCHYNVWCVGSSVEGWPGALIVTAIEHGISTCNSNSTPCKILLRGKSLDQVLGIPYQKLQK